MTFTYIDILLSNVSIYMIQDPARVHISLSHPSEADMQCYN